MSGPAARWRRSGGRWPGGREAHRERGDARRASKGARQTKTGMVDLLVIGGGINGAGIARDAAGRGLSVILCEKGDLAEGCSSRSGKLVHGGAAVSRILRVPPGAGGADRARGAAPTPPPTSSGRCASCCRIRRRDRPAWLVRLGLFLYDHPAGGKRLPGTRGPYPPAAGSRRGAAARQVHAGVRIVGLLGGRRAARGAERVDAKEKGAEVLTRTPCVSARREDGGWTAQLRTSGGGRCGRCGRRSSTPPGRG